MTLQMSSVDNYSTCPSKRTYTLLLLGRGSHKLDQLGHVLVSVQGLRVLLDFVLSTFPNRSRENRFVSYIFFPLLPSDLFLQVRNLLAL